MNTLRLLPAVNYRSCLSPPPLPSFRSPQTCKADHYKVLILKFTEPPNKLNTVASICIQQRSHFTQNQTQHQTVHGTHTKSVKRTTVLCGACMFFQQNNMHVSQPQYIHFRKHSLKSRFLPPESSQGV